MLFSSSESCTSACFLISEIEMRLYMLFAELELLFAVLFDLLALLRYKLFFFDDVERLSGWLISGSSSLLLVVCAGFL